MFIYILGIGDRSGKFGDIDRSLGLPFFWLYNVVENTLKPIFLKFCQIPPRAP